MADVVGVIEGIIDIDTSDLDVGERMIDKFSKKFDDMANEIAKQAKKIVLALAGIAVATIKLASDAEETEAKFNTAFRGIENQAQKMARELSKSYLIGLTESKRLLAGTGDLLKGMGYTAEGALDLSFKVQTLASDLASYNNVQGGTKRVSEALTKALLGERESLKLLGINISETMLKQEMLKRGMKDLQGTALLSAKAQVTLDLAMQQSKDAIGDISRTSGSFANQFRLLISNVKELGTSFGKELLPSATQVVSKLNVMIGNLQNLDFGKALQIGIDKFKELGKITIGTIIILKGFALATNTAFLSLARAMAVPLAIFGSIVVIIGTVKRAVNELKMNFDGLKKVLDTVLDTFKTDFLAITGEVKKFTGNLKIFKKTATSFAAENIELISFDLKTLKKYEKISLREFKSISRKIRSLVLREDKKSTKTRLDVIEKGLKRGVNVKGVLGNLLDDLSKKYNLSSENLANEVKNLNSDGVFAVGQGELDKVTNEIKSASDSITESFKEGGKEFFNLANKIGGSVADLGTGNIKKLEKQYNELLENLYKTDKKSKVFSSPNLVSEDPFFKSGTKQSFSKTINDIPKAILERINQSDVGGTTYRKGISKEAIAEKMSVVSVKEKKYERVEGPKKRTGFTGADKYIDGAINILKGGITGLTGIFLNALTQNESFVAFMEQVTQIVADLIPQIMPVVETFFPIILDTVKFLAESFLWVADVIIIPMVNGFISLLKGIGQIFKELGKIKVFGYKPFKALGKVGESLDNIGYVKLADKVDQTAESFDNLNGTVSNLPSTIRSTAQLLNAAYLQNNSQQRVSEYSVVSDDANNIVVKVNNTDTLESVVANSAKAGMSKGKRAVSR